MSIRQGDVYWVPLPEPDWAEPGIIHPHVVIQDDIITRSRIKTVVVCGLTTNMKRAFEHGNILLEVGEANLPGGASSSSRRSRRSRSRRWVNTSGRSAGSESNRYLAG